MADLTFYVLSMTGEEADSGIRVGMDIGALNGIPFSNGNNEILAAIPGVDYGYPLLQGYGPPTANTAASFGQHYYDLSATAPPFEWICIAFTETEGFVWRQHNDAGYFQATYGATSYQDIIKNYNLGKVCIVVDSNNDIFYLGQVETNLLTFYRAFRNVSSAQDGARIEYKNVRVTSTNTWSSFYYYGENTANRTTVVNEQSTDAQYPTTKAVYTYGQNIGTAAKEYTDEQLEPVGEAADKAEDYALGAYVTPTASGAVASFDDGADELPVKSLAVDIEPVQAGTGEPRPENVRPISGWTGVKVQRTGKNLLDINPDKAVSRQRLDIIPIDGGYEMTSTNSYGRVGYLVEGLEVGETYALSMLVSRPVASSSACTIYLNDSGNWDSGRGFNVGAGGEIVTEQQRTATITTSTGKIFIGFYVSAGNGYPDTLIVKNVQLELGTTSTAYEPYQDVTYDIGFPDEVGMVYGGTLNVTSGVLTVDKTMDTFNSDTPFTLLVEGARKVWQAQLSAEISERTSPLDDVIGNGVVTLSALSEGDVSLQNEVTCRPTSYRSQKFYIFTPTSWTVENVKALLAPTPLQIVYPLATPIPYQLTPIEVKTLLGVNNIYADTGDTEVTYRADPTLIYNKLTAAIISSSGTV